MEKNRGGDQGHAFFYDTFYQGERGKNLKAKSEKSLKIENRIRDERFFAPKYFPCGEHRSQIGIGSLASRPTI